MWRPKTGFTVQHFLGIDSFLASSDPFCLLVDFPNGLDPDQARQNVNPDLDPKSLTF